MLRPKRAFVPSQYQALVQEFKTHPFCKRSIIVGKDVPSEVFEFYSQMCPAGVYERVGDSFRINTPNCIDCKATDVLGPRYRRM